MREFMNLVENGGEAFFYHGTTRDKLETIMAEGIKPTSHWGTENVARLFAKDHGGESVILRVPLSAFNPAMLFPDEKMIDYPIYDDAEYEERYEMWSDSAKDWKASLRYFEAVEYAEPVTVDETNIL